MTKKFHLFTGAAIIALAVILSGCELGKNGSESQEVLMPERPGVTLKGRLSTAGNKYFVSEGAKNTEIVSKKIDLKSRVGTEIEVYGEFSGTTLYVDEIK
jgi:hypothetical protein